ncbi:Uncharacterised protein [Mycobacteroides abscessus subsp. abscessus]|nr:Uncharacterised protein [Mycobacteroides abscessus subsp. abscessus]
MRSAASWNPAGAGLPTATALRPDTCSIPARYTPVSTRSPSRVLHTALRCIATTGMPWAINSYTRLNATWSNCGPAPPRMITSGSSERDSTKSTPAMSAVMSPSFSR